MQGFYFGKPFRAADISEILQAEETIVTSSATIV